MRTYYIVLDHSMKKIIASSKGFILSVGIEEKLSYR